MAKKRKSDATRLDEVDRTMYTTFCSAANSLSQLYTQAMNHQRLSFQAGERHAMCSFMGCGSVDFIESSVGFMSLFVWLAGFNSTYVLLRLKLPQDC
ncbi:hypothetical protein JRO89_XS08G0043400 [Xanthoceras sorbifolium]|uniref:Uncharacterized protein n=1 Tax=Xanthoceras sorbifolium TaxID=99658 RepID=A0ABQ8HNL6_9ROSI|nr:hypothetical protein JRO89_XS08G0043400 [Xanthoceras sorbifolium]